jgi:putative ABC transport system permease protein
MTPQKLLALVLQSIRRNRRDYILSSIGIVVGIATLLFFTALGSGIKTVVLERVFVIGQLEVVKKTFEVGGLRSSGLFGGGTRLDDAMVTRLSEIPGVTAVYPKMKFTFPARAQGGRSILGQDMGAELIADGIPPELVAGEVTSDFAFKDWGAPTACQANDDCHQGFACTDGTCTARACNPRDVRSTVCGEVAYCEPDARVCTLPIPVLVNPMLLEVYNGSVHTALSSGRGAGSRLPRLTQDMLIGFEFDAVLGQSFLGQSGKGDAYKARMRLVGFSDKATQFGVTIPIGYVKRFNTQFTGGQSGEEYHSIVIDTASNDVIAHVARTVTEDLGLELSERYANAQRAGLLILLITIVFNLIALVILTISAINIMHTFLMMIVERRRELALMRALGATRTHIRLLVLGEATILGFFGALAGLLAGTVAITAVDALFHHLVGEFPFKPDSLFLIEPWMWLAAFSVALVFCWLGALIPALRASRIDPAVALSGH